MTGPWPNLAFRNGAVGSHGDIAVISQQKTSDMQQLIFSFLLLSLLAACTKGTSGQNSTTESGSAMAEIAALEAQLLETGDASKNRDVAKELVAKTEAFAEANPADPRTPEMLFKAADVANGAGNFGKAVQLWGQVWRNYPDHEQAPMALFLQGFTFDSKLSDAKMATKYYQQFLKTYPGHELEGQVKQLLSVVQVPPEQLIKQFNEEQ